VLFGGVRAMPQPLPPTARSHGVGYALAVCALCVWPGCTATELRAPTAVFPLTIGPQTYRVEVAARQSAARQTINYRALPSSDRPFLALHRAPGQIRWNSRNVAVPLDGAFLDSAGRVLRCFTSTPLSRRDHVSPPDARALLLAPIAFVRHAELRPGSAIRIPSAVWAYARQCWQQDDVKKRARWQAIGYRTPEQRWGEAPPTPPRPASTDAPR